MKANSNVQPSTQEGITIRLPHLPSFKINEKIVGKLIPLLSKTAITLVVSIALLLIVATLALAYVVQSHGGSLELDMGKTKFRLIVPSTGVDQLSVRPEGKSVNISYDTRQKKRVSVTDAASDKVLETDCIDDQRWSAQLFNVHREAVLRTVVVGDDPAVTIALPGSVSLSKGDGDGTVAQLLLSTASYYNLPVVARGLDLKRPARWSFSSFWASEAVERSLGQQECSASLDKWNVLNVTARIRRGSQPRSLQVFESVRATTSDGMEHGNRVLNRTVSHKQADPVNRNRKKIVDFINLRSPRKVY